MKLSVAQKIGNRLRQGWASRINAARIKQIADQVVEQSRPSANQKPVVIFNASARLTGMSLNAAFSLLTGWSLRLTGVPVVHFVCRAGMSYCVQGTNRQDYTKPPPCAGCIHQSDQLFRGAQVHWFSYEPNEGLAAKLEGFDIEGLMAFEYELPWNGSEVGGRQSGVELKTPIPLGKLVLPSIRWALRCHHLPDDQPTRSLYREYILSAYHVACQFSQLLVTQQPSVAIIFNGVMYPEAVARWVARQEGVVVITHEVGFTPFSAFFTDGEATAYPIQIPDEFDLSPAQQARLDEYLEQRFQGKFTMAGIRFWPEMKGLDASFLERLRQSGTSQVVPVFTNVIYDTSQVHANTIFEHMFAWLDAILPVIQVHPETLFVIRAHPDEMRPGTRKQSRESVRDWVERNKISKLPNVIFVDSQEYLSSYELIQRAKFLMVYNSSIGLEATLMGTPVLCAGKARYTQIPTVFLPASIEDFNSMVESFLTIEKVELPPEFIPNARKFLYYQLYKASLPFEDFLQNMPRPGFVALKPFDWQQLLPKNSLALRTIQNGILYGSSFLLDEPDAAA